MRWMIQWLREIFRPDTTISDCPSRPMVQVGPVIPVTDPSFGLINNILFPFIRMGAPLKVGPRFYTIQTELSAFRIQPLQSISLQA